MLFCLFNSISFIKEYEFNVSSQMFILQSFGFSNNSLFQISVELSIPSQISIFWIPESNHLIHNFDVNFGDSVCSGKTHILSPYNFTSVHSQTSILYTDKIKETNLYTSVIINCQNPQNKYRIKIYCRNERSLLDYRYESFSSIYIVFSILYSALGIICFINIFCYPQFYIKLCFLFSTLIVFKSLYMAISAIAWDYFRIVENLPLTLNIIATFIQFLTYFLLIYFFAMALSGWCIYRESISKTEQKQIFICSLISIFSFTLLEEPISNNLVIIFSFVACFGFAYYLRLISTYVFNIFKLIEIQEESDILDKKITLLKHFFFGSMIMSAAFILSFAWAVTLNASPTLLNVIYETIAFGVYTLWFLMLRNSSKYAGTKDDYSDKEMTMIYIEEPTSIGLATLQQNDLINDNI